MRPKTGAALLALMVPAMLLAQGPKADTAAEYKALKESYDKEYKAFVEPFSKLKTDEERMKFDWSKAPAGAYLPKFLDLAKKAKDTEGGRQATAQVWNLSMQTNPPDLKAARWAIDELVSVYPDAPELSRITGQLAYSYPFEAEEAQSYLRKIANGPKTNATVKPGALQALAHNLLSTNADDGKAKLEGRQLMERVQREYAGTPHAERAKGMLFELNNLQVGQVAPDFETVDENGKTWKLSDYRGKVVVVDFWGFW
jgi:hypothetical protein